jgi:membrane-associated phospholipid phosphatase
MAPVRIHQTRLDELIAREVASHTDCRLECGAKIVTWGADEHVLLGLATLGWILTRTAQEPTRRLGSHVLACSLVTTALPHIMKRFIDQKRPDRLTIKGHLRGIPLSGNAEDAFPSGHALHVGALASSATLLPTEVRAAVWGIGAVLVATRVVLLAHWFTDVLAGLAMGAVVERAVRTVTKPEQI